jgi:hypothetical protein
VSGAALFAIEAFHPAMEVRVLAPVVEFRRIANVEIDCRVRLVTKRAGVHIESHFSFLSSVTIPKDAERKAGRQSCRGHGLTRPACGGVARAALDGKAPDGRTAKITEGWATER